MKKYILIILILSLSQAGFSQKVGLALSGGGARGFAHIGVLKVLDEENIKVEAISGTSSGALIASLYACGYSALEIEEMILSIDWLGLIDEKISRNDKQINFKLWQEEHTFSFRLLDDYKPMLPQSAIAGNAIINQLSYMMWECSSINNFDDFEIPLRITATDILEGKADVFREGNLAEVNFASFCFPTIIKPFKLGHTYYIDGGIRSNLPVKPLLSTQADYYIGLKANSPLKEAEELNNVVDILEQTANIAIKNNVENSISLCSLLIEPDLEEYSMLDFDKIPEIIKAGEEAAREKLEILQTLPRRTEPGNVLRKKAERLKFSEIRVEGNEILDKREIKHYLELRTGKKYCKENIRTAFKRAYSTDLFELIYPIVKKENGKYILIVKVKEKQRSHLKINPRYDLENDISLLLLGDFKNLIQRNSRLLSGLTIGKNNQFCLDYFKNFGNKYGFFYHIFPYISDLPLYTYDEDNQKTNSVMALETGETAGIGFFFNKSLAVELYNFAYQKRLYRDIGNEELNDLYYNSVGMGLRLSFETLDALYFPMKGIKVLSKVSIASSEDNTSEDYKKSLQKIELIHPLTRWFSIRYHFEYGSYFEKMVPYDPFYIGGMDSFLGLRTYERSASIYKINSLSFRLNPHKNLYIEPVINNLKLGDYDSWELTKDLEWGVGLILGYKTILGPASLGFGIMEKSSPVFYLSLGYNLDVFEYSRR